MTPIRELQSKVNEIANGLGGIDSLEKLKQARQIARQDPDVQALAADILDEAIRRRWTRDTALSLKRLLATSTQETKR